MGFVGLRMCLEVDERESRQGPSIPGIRVPFLAAVWAEKTRFNSAAVVRKVACVRSYKIDGSLGFKSPWQAICSDARRMRSVRLPVTA